MGIIGGSTSISDIQGIINFLLSRAVYCLEILICEPVGVRLRLMIIQYCWLDYRSGYARLVALAHQEEGGYGLA